MSIDSHDKNNDVNLPMFVENDSTITYMYYNCDCGVKYMLQDFYVLTCMLHLRYSNDYFDIMLMVFVLLGMI